MLAFEVIVGDPFATFGEAFAIGKATITTPLPPGYVTPLLGCLEVPGYPPLPVPAPPALPKP